MESEKGMWDVQIKIFQVKPTKLLKTLVGCSESDKTIPNLGRASLGDDGLRDRRIARLLKDLGIEEGAS